MNTVALVGNVATDIRRRQTQSGITCASFRLAVNRDYIGQDGKRATDFFTVECWRQTAEFVSENVSKGDRLAVTGSLRTDQYEDIHGQKKVVTVIVGERIEIVKKKGASSDTDPHEPYSDGDGDEDFVF